MDERWRTIAAVRPHDLADAALELHWAAQLLASCGQTFGEERADDRHRAMVWDSDLRSFVGVPLAGTYPFRVALRPEDLTLVLLDRPGGALGSLPLPGVTADQARAWLAAGLATYMGGSPVAMEQPEYEMPPHAVGEGRPFAVGRTVERAALAALYGSAASILEELISTRRDASPVTCWPHHFDIATLVTLERDAGGHATRTVGAGLAPMGGGYDAWYWYVTPWPYPDAANLPELSGPGAWHTGEWTGAVLTGGAIVEADPAFREAVVRKFLDVSVEAAAASLRS